MATIITLLRLSFVIGVFFSSIVLATHAQGDNPDNINQFKSISIESQVAFVEEMLHADLSKVPQLLQFLKINPAKKTKDLTHRILLIEAFMFISSANVDTAHKVLLSVHLDKPNLSNLARVLYLRGRLAQYLGDYRAAFNFLNNAAQLPSESHQTKNDFFLLMLAADLNHFIGRFDAAIEYNTRGVNLAISLNDQDLVCFALASQTEIFVNSKDFKLLESTAYLAIEACEKSNNVLMLGDIYQDFSYIYLEKKNYKLQQQLLKSAIDIYRNNASDFSIPAAKLLLVNSYISNNQFSLATNLLSELFVYVNELWGEEERKELYLAKSYLLEKQQKHVEALVFFKKYLAMEEQDTRDHLAIQPAYYQAQFDSEINSQVSKIAIAEQQYLNIVSVVGNLEVWLFVIISLLALTIPMYGLTFYHRRQKVLIVEGGKFDDLTNVFLFEQGVHKVRAIIKEQHQSISHYAVIAVDIDMMKAINNSYNYDFGDLFLRSFAHSLEKMFAPIGIITRVRRNDFVIFIAVNSEAEVIRLIEQIHYQLDNLVVGKHRPKATCSVGFSCFNMKSYDKTSDLCTHLVGQASIALRYSKTTGGNKWSMYDKDLASKITKSNHYLDDDDETDVYFQPF